MKHKLLLASICLIMGAGGLSAQEAGQEQTPTVYLVADAHLDTQWNWDVRTTIDKYVYNTLVQNLWLLDNYPNYVFNFEGAVKYNWMKEYYPLEYERIKKYIQEGRWHISGSTWDATDTNIPSPESFFKNILLGQMFYKNEFGVKSTDIFLPDCFGFGYTLPTIASHCGLIGFSTQKLGWRNNPFYEGGK
ncbi:MAG TPA: alpha-mannosidase, partial [Candidatus Gallibacteroides avistercoris]|nr:alpha-mannosidase [Candidatus Gallibacteroides avistercoris]